MLIHDESYQYDLNGNRELVTNANGDLVVYSTGLNNELNSDGNYSYTYDAEGNRISKTNAAGTERELYEWDYRNRLSSVTKQTFDSVSETWQTVQIVEYAYDYNNVLIRKVLDADGDGISDSKTIFLPENYQTAIQLDDADLSDNNPIAVSHRYLWTPDQQDKLLADVTPTETLWTLTDHLGTVRDIIQNTPSGLLVPAHVIYDAYGNVLSCKDANGTDVSNPVLFGFTGKYFDADTQLQNNVNRWYDATVGRWLSTDPIGFNGNDTNLYRYVGNKITQFIDYLGYKSCRCEQLLEQFVKSEQFQFDLYLAGKKDSYFLSNGNQIDNKKILGHIMSESEKRNKKITILVCSLEGTQVEKGLCQVKSKDIICPKCQELCEMKIKKYKIILCDCKNGHIIKDIKFNEFEQTQKIDISKIKCDKCKNKNKANTYNNEFYKCIECNMNLCPLCKTIHEKIHKIITNYDDKNYICKKHKETLIKYCEHCKLDICSSCVNEHKNHKIKSYEDKFNDIRKKMQKLKYVIKRLKVNLEKIIEIFNVLNNNMEIYYNFNNNIIKNYEKK